MFCLLTLLLLPACRPLQIANRHLFSCSDTIRLSVTWSKVSGIKYSVVHTSDDFFFSLQNISAEGKHKKKENESESDNICRSCSCICRKKIRPIIYSGGDTLYKYTDTLTVLCSVKASSPTGCCTF